MKRTILLVAFVILIIGQPVFAQRLHAILVADTSSNLADSVQADIDNLRWTLRDGLPRDRLRLIVITGNRVTRSNITNTLRRLVINRRDAVMLYFSGHGGFDPNRGHYLSMAGTRDGRLYRSKVIESITQPVKPRFWAVVTDCCASFDRGGEMPMGAPTMEPRRKVLLTHLFLETRGRLDITSSRPGQVSLGPPPGGLFTMAFCNVLRANAYRKLDWDEVFYKTRAETGRSAEQLGNIDHYQRGVRQKTQTPYSFRTMYGKNVNGFRLGVAHDNRVITSVFPGSAASRSGLRPGMRIRSVNSLRMQDDDQIITAVNFSKRKAFLGVEDRGEKRSIRVWLSY